MCRSCWCARSKCRGDHCLPIRRLTQAPLQRPKTRVKVLFLTNEYPPHIYGGAGIHVGYLSRELAKTMPVEVRCFGDQRIEKGNLRVTGFEVDASAFTCSAPLKSAFGAVRRCVDFISMNIYAVFV